jgi:hypothetical protein
VPMISCTSCGTSTFAFARRDYVASCRSCGAPLTGRQDTTAIESEIRDRLYGRRSRFSTPDDWRDAESERESSRLASAP